MLKKIIKWIVVVVIIGMFSLYLSKIGMVVETSNEPKKYINITSFFSSGNLSVIFLKEVPASVCLKVLQRYLEPSLAQCKSSGCRIKKQGCFDAVDEGYSEAFKKRKIRFPYVYKEYADPEVTIYKNIAEDKFSLACEFEKNKTKVNTICNQ